jgi:hypothetical protein
MRQAELIGYVGEMGNAYSTSVVNLQERDHSEDLDVDGKVILKWILGERWWENVKGKVPVLFLTEHRAMKAYLGSGGIAPLIL